MKEEQIKELEQKVAELQQKVAELRESEETYRTGDTIMVKGVCKDYKYTLCYTGKGYVMLIDEKGNILDADARIWVPDTQRITKEEMLQITSGHKYTKL